MLYTNITKIPLLVILCSTAALVAGCSHSPVSGGAPPAYDSARSQYSEARQAGRVESGEITESSGLAASRCQDKVLWTHNDSDGGPFLFAIDETGRDLGVWRVTNAENLDWEDIAAYRDGDGKCFVYIGDIGNRRKEPRTEHKIYRVAEPKVSAGGGTSRNEAAATEPAEVMSFYYPDGPRDAETLMVHPAGADIYVVSKIRDAAAGVYKLRPAFGNPPVRAERVSDLTVPAIPNGFLTAGDIAPDGKRLVISDYFAAYEFLLPAEAKGFDEIWKQKPAVIDLGDRDQGEAVCYSADGNSLFATSEGKYKPLVRVDRR